MNLKPQILQIQNQHWRFWTPNSKKLSILKPSRCPKLKKSKPQSACSALDFNSPTPSKSLLHPNQNGSIIIRTSKTTCIFLTKYVHACASDPLLYSRFGDDFRHPQTPTPIWDHFSTPSSTPTNSPLGFPTVLNFAHLLSICTQLALSYSVVA